MQHTLLFSIGMDQKLVQTYTTIIVTLSYFPSKQTKNNAHTISVRHVVHIELNDCNRLYFKLAWHHTMYIPSVFTLIETDRN